MADEGKVVPLEPTNSEWHAIQAMVDDDCPLSIVANIGEKSCSWSDGSDRIVAYAKAAYTQGKLSAAPAARSDAGLVERLRAGCPLLPESESPDEDMFDYEASNKLMLEAAAAIERQGEPVAWLCEDDLRRLKLNGEAIVYEEKQEFILTCDIKQFPLYARPAIGGVAG